MGGDRVVVAGWVLEERIGGGSFGEVWNACRQHVDIHRALKLVRVFDDDAFDAWRQEAAQLEALSHPAIVRFYDADIVSEGPYQGFAWIATELCDHSLADELDRQSGGVLPSADCERLLADMLGALAAARTGGVVHRDVKPANILRAIGGGGPGGAGTWKLADFGTARLLSADTTHPLTGIIGTQAYMSPDAHHGRQNHAADLYALGVTLHEALTGRRLHPRPEAISDGEYRGLVVESPPTIDSRLPARWRTVVEALIGRHGPLPADELAVWFAMTRGRTPPEAKAKANSDGNGSAPATAPTAASPNGNGSSNGTGARTAATALSAPPEPADGSGVRVAEVRPARSSRPPGQVIVPAPPRPAPSPPRPAPALPQFGSGAVPIPAPTPAHPGFRPRSAPAPAPAAYPVVARSIARRRLVAALLDILFLLAVGSVGWSVVLQATGEEVPAARFRDAGQACGDADTSECVSMRNGDSIYVSHNPGVPMLGFVLPALVAGVVQGRTGRTPGKLVTGLRLARTDGRPPRLMRMLFRTAVSVIDMIPFVPVVGLVAILGSDGRRRVADIASGTRVVRVVRPR